jgi:hypothetical protein
MFKITRTTGNVEWVLKALTRHAGPVPEESGTSVKQKPSNLWSVCETRR